MVRDSSPFDEQPDVHAILTAIGDETVRTLLESLTESKSVHELSGETGIPLSTVYRKLSSLEDASLVDSSITITSGGQYTTHYIRNFESLVVEIDDNDRLIATIEHSKNRVTPEKQLEELWGEIHSRT